MKKSFLMIFFLLIAFSCDNYDSENDCYHQPSDCMEYPPSTGYVEITVNFNDLNRAVPIEIYEGNFEDGRLVLKSTLTTTQKRFNLPSDKKYSAIGIYNHVKDGENIVIYTLDGGKLDHTTKEYCEGDCYEEGTLDLNLKLYVDE